MCGYCIICKKITEGRFEVTLMDNKTQIVTDSTLCRDCYNNLLDNHEVNTNSLKISRLSEWIKGSKKK